MLKFCPTSLETWAFWCQDASYVACLAIGPTSLQKSSLMKAVWNYIPMVPATYRKLSICLWISCYVVGLHCDKWWLECFKLAQRDLSCKLNFFTSIEWPYTYSNFKWSSYGNSLNVKETLVALHPNHPIPLLMEGSTISSSSKTLMTGRHACVGSSS